MYLGPFPQATLAAPRSDLQPLGAARSLGFGAPRTSESQVYVLMTTVAGVGKDLRLQLRIAGALVGESAHLLSFAKPLATRRG